jgi:hypothetical protein
MTNRLNTVRVQIVTPKEATNLITNPSAEIDTTGYTASGAGVSINRVTTQSRRGIASIEITTAANVDAGLFYGIALTNGVQYTFSADIKDVAGQTFNLYFYRTTIKAITTWTGTGYWKRRSITYTADATNTFYLFITRSSVNSTTKFYTDGWQLEAGTETTYLDGDMVGTVIGQTDYRWNGTPHASTSWRSGQTRTGGTLTDLATYGKILNIVGGGMEPLTNIAIPSSMGGSFYQNTISLERPFSVIMNLNASVAGGDLGAIYRNRAALIALIRPDSVTRKQPITLKIDQLDVNSAEIAETLYASCFYDGGLEGGEADAFNERVALKFRAYKPYYQQQGEKGITLGYQLAISNANYVLKRGSDGTWAALSTGFNAAVGAVAVDPRTGYIYFGGLFTNAGDANGDYIVGWNGSAFFSLGTGMNGSVQALAFDAAGNLWAGGAFTSAGGVSNTARIAYWDGANWHAISTGIGSGIVYTLAIGPNGYIYIGGSFTNVGDANGDYITSWTGSAFASLTTGTNGDVKALAFDKDGNLYAGGAFTLAGGVTATAYIAKWNGTAWSALSTGMNDQVYCLLVFPDNTLYAGGAFTAAGGVVYTYGIAKWNGSGWSPLNQGVIGSVYSLLLSPYNNLYVSGSITQITGLASLPDSVATWNGNNWQPLDVDLPGSATIFAMCFDLNNNLYIGFSTSGTAYASGVSVPNNGTASVYPVIRFTGPGTVYSIRNYTTGKSIYFNALTLQAGETAALNLDPYNRTFISSFRGSIYNTLLGGSDMNFELLPGVNNIACFIYGTTTAATALQVTWRDTYHSIDGATR